MASRSIGTARWSSIGSMESDYLIAHGSLDKDKEAETYVIFDADTGALLDASWPGKATEKTGDAISRWLFMLHMARVFGLPMKIFVCVMGFVITALSITGVYIWLKKRAARKRRVRAGASKPPPSRKSRLGDRSF